MWGSLPTFDPGSVQLSIIDQSGGEINEKGVLPVLRSCQYAQYGAPQLLAGCRRAGQGSRWHHSRPKQSEMVHQPLKHTSCSFYII